MIVDSIVRLDCAQQVALKIVERMKASRIGLDVVSYTKAINAANVGTTTITHSRSTQALGPAEVR